MTVVLDRVVTVADLLSLLVGRTDTDHSYNDRASDVVPTAEDVAEWSAQTGLDPDTLFNELGLALAREYYLGKLSYTTCDFIVNDLHAYAQPDVLLHIDVFLDAYWAFGEGEFYHTDDRSDDPEMTHVRPLIWALLDRAEQG